MTPEERQAHQAERDKEIKALCQWRDDRAQKLGRERRADVEAEWRKLRETNPRAGGAGVDALLGVETPEEPLRALPADLAQPKPAAAAPHAPAQGPAFKEATRADTDFIERLCGKGSDKPSGRPGGSSGWLS